MLRQSAWRCLARAQGSALQRDIQTGVVSLQKKYAPEGKDADDPQNTEGTLTDNTDSRVGLKDTTDTTPGYFYKGEVEPDAAHSGPGLDSGGGAGPGEEKAVDKQKAGEQPPDVRKKSGLPPPNIPYFEGLSEPSKEEREARTHEISGTLVEPPEPPEARAADKGPPPGPPGPDLEGPVPHGKKESFLQQDEGDMTNVKWGEKPRPDKMPGDFRQHYKP